MNGICGHCAGLLPDPTNWYGTKKKYPNRHKCKCYMASIPNLGVCGCGRHYKEDGRVRKCKCGNMLNEHMQGGDSGRQTH